MPTCSRLFRLCHSFLQCLIRKPSALRRSVVPCNDVDISVACRWSPLDPNGETNPRPWIGARVKSVLIYVTGNERCDPAIQSAPWLALGQGPPNGLHQGCITTPRSPYELPTTKL